VGVLAAYAIAMQSLLIAIGAAALPVQAADQSADAHAFPAYVICEHAGQPAPQDAPGLPAPDQIGFEHCVFCFAGTHVAVLASPMLPPFHVVGVTVRVADWNADRSLRPNPAAYAIARPRGPPAQA
jgi:hypothetical protein